MSEWETFCDLCYYDLWRVRRKNERGFNDGYHIHNGEEAHALVDLLNGLERERNELRSDLEFRRNLFQLQEQQLNEVRVERDEWKQKFIQQNKDLGCEMMDPGGTIWDYAKKLQDDIAGWETKWKCAVEMAAMAENERDKLKEQIDARELEMFAIRSSLSDAKAEIEEIREQLNAYITLDKMAMRKFIREREQERQNQCRQSPTTNQ